MPSPVGVTAKLHNLPRQLTPFVGRQTEVTQIIAQLAEPGCCLLTLVGPGGIGKTRLALAAAQQLIDLDTPEDPKSKACPERSQNLKFNDGIFFVNLQPLGAADVLVSAVCDALTLPLGSHEAPQTQLLHYLRDKQMLLILDNFEHLLAGTTFITNLLQAAPKVKLLVTSREALNLHEERLLRVGGLTFPPRLLADEEERKAMPASATDAAAGSAYSAVQLFVERAQRVRQPFVWQAEAEAILQICRLVEGMPLALELAATWTKTMRCAEIAAEIERRSDFLTSNLRNLPERHRSMQAVFEHSWRLLHEPERQVFQRLAIFRGGFNRQAAEAVTGATLPVLSALVDKSFLRWEADGRYQIHELLRQAAHEQLDQTPGAAAQIQEAHGRYFADFADRSYKTLIGIQQPQFPAHIAAELENLRQAWQWAVQTANLAAIEKIADPLQQFYDLRGRCLESAALLTVAVARLEALAAERQPALTLAFVLTLLGWIYMRVGQLAEARAAFARSRALYEQWQALPRQGFTDDPWVGLAHLAHVCGHYVEALALGEAERRRHEAGNDAESLQVVYYVLANANFALGHYDLAGEQAQRAYALSQTTGNRWFGAFVLNDLGHVARVRGDYAQARRYYQESYAVKAAFTDQEGMALALRNLATVARLEADYVQAEALYQQSLAIYRRIDDQGGLATVLNGLGDTACAFGNLAAARHYFQQALQIARQMRYWPLTLSILVSIGELLLLFGQRARGGDLCEQVLAHPAGQQETKNRAAAALQKAKRKPTDASPMVNSVAYSEADLMAIAEALIFELSTPTTSAEPAAAPDQPLIEPLTEREREVLQLLADGLSNQAIADQLVIAKGTVKSYTGAIYGKLGVRSRTQAVARAYTLKLLKMAVGDGSV